MASFSAGEAIGAGFRIIRRTPWAVLVWALVYIVLMLPMLAAYAVVAPQMMAAYQAMLHAGAGGPPPDPAQMMAFNRQIMTLQPVVMLSAIVASTIMTAAIFRAVLEPEACRWAFLRLGAQELWLGLTTLVFMVLVGMMAFAVIIPVVIGVGIATAAAHHGGGSGAGLFTGLVMFAGFALIVWVALRLSLALPMSFARRNFLLFESWALTRGQALKMFMVLLALVVIVWLAEIVLVAVFWGVVLGLAGLDFGRLSTIRRDELIRQLVPIALVLLPVGAVLLTAMRTVMVAPWADIYRQLTREGAPA